MLGNKAEDKAVKYLKRRSFRIIERNFRHRLGEIDIIAEDGNELVIIEVRSGHKGLFHDPVESITAAKIGRLRRLAMLWLYNHGLSERNVRFDVIIVEFSETIGIFGFKRIINEIRHFENAF